jgi:hypothetical protein
MRTQITVYIDAELKKWLRGYRRKLHLKESEIIRLLISREQKVEWIKRALALPDPEGDLIAQSRGLITTRTRPRLVRRRRPT